MNEKTTPKKVYTRTGRKEKPVGVDDFCRLCDCSLKNKYGSIGSFVNLFKTSQREKLQGKILAALCSEIGLHLEENPDSSSRVCPPCSRKMLNCSQLYLLISSKCTSTANISLRSEVVVKRQLPTTVTPIRNPSGPKLIRTNSPKTDQCGTVSHRPTSNRKSLFQDNSSDKNNQVQDIKTAESDVLRYFNIDDICDTKTTIVKLLLLYPNGNVTVRTPRNRKTINLVKNIVLKK